MASPFTLTSILRQKKTYGNSNISSCKNLIFEKILLRNKNPFKTILTRGVSHYGPAVYIKKSFLKRKKNYGNSNISPCKNLMFQKLFSRNQNPFKTI
jgi:hypothetical protein